MDEKYESSDAVTEKKHKIPNRDVGFFKNA